jgi:ribosome biogenesis protein Tsr3
MTLLQRKGICKLNCCWLEVSTATGCQFNFTEITTAQRQLPVLCKRPSAKTNFLY